MASRQTESNDDELESTAELPLVSKPRPGVDDDATGSDERPAVAEGSREAAPARSEQPEAAVDDAYDDSLDDTADLSDLISLQDTSELPLVRGPEDAGEEDPTTELPLVGDGDPGEGGASGQAEGPAAQAEGDGSAHEEVPDAEPGEVVSAATLQRDEKRRRRRRAGVVAAVVAVLLAVYLGGAWYFSDRFFPRTTVNGADASGLTTGELASSLQASAQDFSTTVSGSGFELSVAGGDIGYAVDGDAMAQAARAGESAWAWPVEVFRAHDLSVPVSATYDDTLLIQVVDSAVEAFNEDSMNTGYAYVGYDYGTQQYKVSGSVTGSALSAQAVHDTLADAVENDQSTASLPDDAVRKATLDDCLELQQVVDIVNRDRDATISITVNGEEKWSLGRDIRSWVSVSHSRLVVNESAISRWATYYLSPSVAYSADGADYTLDVESMVKTLVDHLEQGNTDPIEAPMEQTSR